MKDLENELHQLFKASVDEGLLGDVIEYAMFPAGKLFRPKLALAFAQDSGKVDEDHYLLAAAAEAHHAYSLVHDDLPCMDDDDIRRGRASAHKRFGQWQALLAGDALLNLSYEFLARMKSEKAQELILLFSRMMGSRGLILGQFMDLSHQKKNFEQELLMHELKTARLIQFCLQGSLTLTGSKSVSQEEALDLGLRMGVNFQLLDDLQELSRDFDAHESKVNAFLNFDPQKVLERILQNNRNIQDFLREKKLPETGKVYQGFLAKTRQKILASEEAILKRCPMPLDSFRNL